MGEDFDLDAGVADIAESMGFGEDADSEDFEADDGEVSDEDKQEAKKDSEKDDEGSEKTEVTVRQAPSSWSKEQHDNWSKIPKEAQDYVELREKQMLDGIEQYKQGHAQAVELQRVIEPFRESMQKHGVNEMQAIGNLFSHHMALTEGSMDSRQAAFVVLGQKLGIIPTEGQEQVDPRTQELQQRLERIERQEQQREQQNQKQVFSRIESEVEAFAKNPENVYFDEVADDVVVLIKTGLDLPAAYEKAVWANPITRAKEMAKSLDEKIKSGTKTALAAKKASSTNIRPINTSKSSNEPAQSWDETMVERLAQLNNS